MRNTKTPTRWPYLLVGVISMMFAGIIYAWSILKAPLAESFGWTKPELALNFTVTMCCFCIGGLISGIMTRKTSPRVSTITGAVLVAGGFMLASRMSGASVIMLYLFYGGMGGLGIGIAYNAIISTTNAWFPDRKGMCSGALMMGFGGSTLILGNIAGRMIAVQSIGWRTTYLVLGAAIGLVLFVAGLIVRLPPPEMVFPQPKTPDRGKPGEEFEPRDYTTAEMIRRFTFWRFFLFSLATSAVGSTVISFAKDLVMSVGAAAALATMLVGVLSVCNGLGRILCGILFDTVGRRRTMFSASAAAITAAGVTMIAVLTGSLPLMIIGLCLTGVSYGCCPTISAAFTSTFYGNKYFAMNFSIANMPLIPASFIATLASALLTFSGGYVLPFILLLALAVIGLILNLSIKKP